MSPDVMLLAGLGAIFVAVVVGVGAVVVAGETKRAVGRSLAAIEAMRAAPAPLRRQLEPSFGDRVVGPAVRRLVRLAVSSSPAGQAARLRHRLDAAGNPAGWDVERVVAVKALGLLAGAVLGGAGGYLVAGSPVTILLALVGLAALGYFGPDIALYQIGYRRRESLRKQLPDAIDLLTISVEAGLAFDAALAQVARNTEGALAEECFRVLQEMQIGVGRAAALRALGDRSDLPELRGFVGAMVQADTFGIPIANVLRVQSQEMRVKRSQRAEELAQKVPVKILFPLIFCILPALFIVVLGPAVITIVHNLSDAFR